MVDYRSLQWQPSAGYNGPLGTIDYRKNGSLPPSFLPYPQSPAPFSPPPVLPPSQGLTSRSVHTYGVRPDGTPITDPVEAELAKLSRGGSNPDAGSTWRTAQGSVYDPSSSPTPPIPRMRPFMPPQTTQVAQRETFDPFNTRVSQYQDRLPTDLGYMTGPDPTAAQQAITDVTVNGGNGIPGSGFTGGWGSSRSSGAGMPPMPRIRPIPPAQIPLTSLVAPQGGNSRPPMGIPQLPGPITFRKGDTVGKLAKARGMTVSSFADLYGIANPNKIYAGQTVSPQAPVMPRMPSPAQRTPPPRDSGRWEGVLDSFGNII